MPLLSRYFLRLSLLYLVAGLALGSMVQAAPALGWTPAWQYLRPTALHLLFLGWVTQAIMGVAVWMFPVASRAQPQGSPALGWSVLVCLNAGLLLRSATELAMAFGPAETVVPLAIPSALLLLAGGWGFVALIWPRVKTR